MLKDLRVHPLVLFTCLLVEEGDVDATCQQDDRRATWVKHVSYSNYTVTVTNLWGDGYLAEIKHTNIHTRADKKKSHKHKRERQIIIENSTVMYKEFQAFKANAIPIFVKVKR